MLTGIAIIAVVVIVMMVFVVLPMFNAGPAAHYSDTTSLLPAGSTTNISGSTYCLKIGMNENSVFRSEHASSDP